MDLKGDDLPIRSIPIMDNPPARVRAYRSGFMAAMHDLHKTCVGSIPDPLRHQRRPRHPCACGGVPAHEKSWSSFVDKAGTPITVPPPPAIGGTRAGDRSLRRRGQPTSTASRSRFLLTPAAAAAAAQEPPPPPRPRATRLRRSQTAGGRLLVPPRCVPDLAPPFDATLKDGAVYPGCWSPDRRDQEVLQQQVGLALRNKSAGAMLFNKTTGGFVGLRYATPTTTPGPAVSTHDGVRGGGGSRLEPSVTLADGLRAGDHHGSARGGPRGSGESGGAGDGVERLVAGKSLALGRAISSSQSSLIHPAANAGGGSSSSSGCFEIGSFVGGDSIFEGSADVGGSDHDASMHDTGSSLLLSLTGATMTTSAATTTAATTTATTTATQTHRRQGGRGRRPALDADEGPVIVINGLPYEKRLSRTRQGRRGWRGRRGENEKKADWSATFVREREAEVARRKYSALKRVGREWGQRRVARRRGAGDALVRGVGFYAQRSGVLS